jgi:hypothetical protein
MAETTTREPELDSAELAPPEPMTFAQTEDEN